MFKQRSLVPSLNVFTCSRLELGAISLVYRLSDIYRLSKYIYIYIYIYIPGFIKRVPEPGPTISPDPDFRSSPGPLFVEDLTARVVRARPPASGLLAGIKLNSLVSNLGGECQIEILQFRQGGGGERWGR